MKTVVVPLAAGFEEIEAVMIVDVLRRAGVRVTTAGLEGESVTGAHGIEIGVDAAIDDVLDARPEMVALPGGMPGATNLRDDARVRTLLRRQLEEGRWAAAICAAPIALVPAGWTENRAVTSYPGFADQIPCKEYREDQVVVDDRLITSRGPGTALTFSLALVEHLVGRESAHGLASGMLAEQVG